MSFDARAALDELLLLSWHRKRSKCGVHHLSFCPSTETIKEAREILKSYHSTKTMVYQLRVDLLRLRSCCKKQKADGWLEEWHQLNRIVQARSWPAHYALIHLSESCILSSGFIGDWTTAMPDPFVDESATSSELEIWYPFCYHAQLYRWSMKNRGEKSVRAYARAEAFFVSHVFPDVCWSNFPPDWFEEIRLVLANCLSKTYVDRHRRGRSRAEDLDREIEGLEPNLRVLVIGQTGKFSERRAFPTGLKRGTHLAFV